MPRFIDSDLNIRKEFFRFIHCSEGLVRKNLASVILKFLNEDLCLDINDCRRQCYDGAGTVSCHKKDLLHILKVLTK